MPTNPTTPGTGKPSGFSEATNEVSIVYNAKTIFIYRLTNAELDSIASSGASAPMSLLGLTFGAFISLAITVFTVDIKDPKEYATFVAMTWLSGFLSVVFLWASIRASLSYKANLKKIKEETTTKM
jgi:hypothetical protein